MKLRLPEINSVAFVYAHHEHNLSISSKRNFDDCKKFHDSDHILFSLIVFSITNYGHEYGLVCFGWPLGNILSKWLPEFHLLHKPCKYFTPLQLHWYRPVKCTGSTRILEFDAQKPKRHGWHFADGIFKIIFSNQNVGIHIQMSIKFVPGYAIGGIVSGNGLAPNRR